MGQKVRPTGFRTGIFCNWKSRWYASKQDFSELLVEDQKIVPMFASAASKQVSRALKLNGRGRRSWFTFTPPA